MRKKIKKAIPVRYHDGLSQLRPNAGGIDIGASEGWVDVGNKDAEPTRMFETFTADLNRMADWLKSCGIQTVAMESTGVYWIPVCQILESKGIEVYLVNAKQAKNVSGRKSDMLDCQWLRILHSYGLLLASFRPAKDIGVLRAYMRHRQMLIEYAAALKLGQGRGSIRAPGEPPPLLLPPLEPPLQAERSAMLAKTNEYRTEARIRDRIDVIMAASWRRDESGPCDSSCV